MSIFTNDTDILINKYKKIRLIEKIKITNSKYFCSLMNNFINLYSFYENNIKNIDIEISNIHLNDNSNFIGKSIKTKMDKLKYIYHAEYNNIDLYFVTNKKIENINKFIINKLIIISTLKSLFNRKKSYQKITIYDINEKKNLPKKDNEIIGPTNCNSGYCHVIYDSNKNGDIVLYRKEELIKVLIHESIHANFVDYNIIINQRLSNLNKKICTKYNILINESFTETLACMLNMILVSYHSKCDINLIFNNELNFMIKTFTKLMNYYNITKIEDIIVKEGCRRYFKQNTNVFSYYILKTINYLNIETFLNLMDKNTNKFYTIKTKSFITKYVNFVFDNIFFMNKFIKKQKITDRNLRLSLYELRM